MQQVLQMFCKHTLAGNGAKHDPGVGAKREVTSAKAYSLFTTELEASSTTITDRPADRFSTLVVEHITNVAASQFSQV